MQISDDESKKSISSLAESVENGETSSSSFEWKIGLDELFVTCLNSNSDKIQKPIKDYLDLFINTSSNHISIRYCLVSQPNKKFNSNNKQLFNATNWSPITFGVILPSKLRGKISIKILLDIGASASIVRKDIAQTSWKS